jgi:predicted ABC-type ATPase
MPAGKPVIAVLAGVNGAGKSSVGGAMLTEHGANWYNPDTFARQIMADADIDQETANAHAWQYGRRSLEATIADGKNFAFETTLGGQTITALIERAAGSHFVDMIFCGLSSPEQHMQRVALRVSRGGHAIAEERIRTRWLSSHANLIRLLPRLSRLQVFDNSAEAEPGAGLPPPILVLHVLSGRVLHPNHADRAALAATPQWARPVVQAALELDSRLK